MLHRLRFVIAGILIILVNQAVTFAVSASMPDALLPSGTTRYATVFATDYVPISYLEGWVDMPGMVKYITIPSGHTADVIVIFCGTGGVNIGSAWLTTRALIRDAVASPSQFLMTHLVDSTSNCAIFEKSNVSSGSPAVKIQWAVGNPDGATMQSRHMFVIANIH